MRATIPWIGTMLWGIAAASRAAAAITAIGDVTPGYPGVLDPWDVSETLSVGHSSDGSLEVSGGSDVVANQGVVGADATATGHVQVSGAGSTWAIQQDLTIGAGGTGVVRLDNGGQISQATATLGGSGGTGSITVDGAGTQWTAASEIVLGDAGTGTLAIQQQGRASCTTAQLGQQPTAVGNVSLIGQGSRWEIAESLALGAAAAGGEATITVGSGGSRLYVGNSAPAAGASLPTTQSATIVSASTGVATLAIYGGNTLINSGRAYVGYGPSDSGLVSIIGSGSQWQNSGLVSIGVSGAGQLVLDGGRISASSLLTVGRRGQIRGAGTVASSALNNGELLPGPTLGPLSIEGNYTQSPTGKLQIDCTGTDVGGWNSLAVQGTAFLGGELEVHLRDIEGTSFEPQIGTVLPFLTAGNSVSGTFATVRLPNLPADRMWQLRYGNRVAALAVVVAGDYNDNGVVDTADYVEWRQLVGTSLNPDADGDTNGRVDAMDFTVWRSHFGNSAFSAKRAGSPTGAAVPEPSIRSWVIVGLICWTLVGLRQRMRSHHAIGPHGSPNEEGRGEGTWRRKRSTGWKLILGWRPSAAGTNAPRRNHEKNHPTNGKSRILGKTYTGRRPARNCGPGGASRCGSEDRCGRTNNRLPRRRRKF